MDAATLVITSIDREATPGAPTSLYGRAKLMRSVGGHCIEDLVLYFGLDGDHTVGVELQEYRQARAPLAHAGYALRPEAEPWPRFRPLRPGSPGRGNALAD